MVKIRLARHGAKKRPYYKIVAADSRCPRDGKFIEQVGRYNPCSDPKLIEFNVEATDKWIAQGAQMTDVVASLYENYKKDAK
ncbi:MAG: 30S ribosomal protein S16 [Phoenicibacter congonensis]|jgi:small subunit ribosomal protein S16|uniref:Small ribosomal subunit protein bS16 n=1 Tax=Phoenicibacter congonensis TaxID=1944646 RepID=A0AA43RGJ0_9ACTN|nr:30S ribosomal protein S16 [Phoenicibacter congonensis]